MARAPRTASTIAAEQVARAQGNQQAAMVASPAMRRSQYLADALKQMREEPRQISGWGELGARLLAQGLTQRSYKKAEGEARNEAAAASEARRVRLAEMLGGGQEPKMPQAAAPMTAAPQMPVPSEGVAPGMMGVAPQTPMEAPAPQAQPAQQAQQPAQQPVQQQGLGATTEERNLLLGWINSGDPGLMAQAESKIYEIQQRAAEPAFLRQETQMVNGVPFLIDPQTGQARPVFENGLPAQAQTQDVFNPEGFRSGTFAQRDPTGKLTRLEGPPEGFEAAGGRLRPIAGGPQDPSAGGNQITNERNLRGEYQRATEEYRTARAGYQKVEAAAKENSGIGDVAMIFGFMKTIDPTSTVREGEAATVQNTGSIPERIVGLYNRAINGERLTPAQRAEIQSAARTQFGTYEDGYQNRTAEYIDMAQQYGLNPINVVGTQPNRPARRQAAPAAPSGNNRNTLRELFDPAAAAAELARRRRGSR